MNKIIYKYPLKYALVNYITMPLGAQILTVQTQDESMPCIWAVVEYGENTKLISRKIALRFTEEKFEGETGVYIGTFNSGLYYYHVFDLGES